MFANRWGLLTIILSSLGIFIKILNTFSYNFDIFSIRLNVLKAPK